MSEREKNQKKKSKHTGAKVIGGAAILAALFGGGYFGLGIGNGNGGLIGGRESSGEEQNRQESQVPAETKPAETEATTPEETSASTEPEQKVLEIVVKESDIYYQGVKVTLTELDEALLHDYDPAAKTVVTLTDDKAVKGTFDEVTAILAKHKIEYAH